jgi:diguanylate cyclase (GGDEF)-like protein
MEQYFKRPAIIARYGGDEFAMLLPDVDRDAAVEQAEKFRQGLYETPAPGGDDRPPLSMSLGVASFPADAQTRRDLIARADQALYRSKEEGKNLVRAYDSAAGEGGASRH